MVIVIAIIARTRMIAIPERRLRSERTRPSMFADGRARATAAAAIIGGNGRAASMLVFRGKTSAYWLRL